MINSIHLLFYSRLVNHIVLRGNSRCDESAWYFHCESIELMRIRNLIFLMAEMLDVFGLVVRRHDCSAKDPRPGTSLLPVSRCPLSAHVKEKWSLVHELWLKMWRKNGLLPYLTMLWLRMVPLSKCSSSLHWAKALIFLIMDISYRGKPFRC